MVWWPDKAHDGGMGGHFWGSCSFPTSSLWGFHVTGCWCEALWTDRWSRKGRIPVMFLRFCGSLAFCSSWHIMWLLFIWAKRCLSWGTRVSLEHEVHIAGLLLEVVMNSSAKRLRLYKDRLSPRSMLRMIYEPGWRRLPNAVFSKCPLLPLVFRQVIKNSWESAMQMTWAQCLGLENAINQERKQVLCSRYCSGGH